MVHMRKAITTLAALAIAAAPMIGCGDSDFSGTNTGKVNVMLTDAPFPFSEVKSVDVFVVRIDGSITEQSDIGIADENNETGWKTLVEPNASFDLLSLSGGKTTSLGIATVPVGTYSSFRVIIDTDKSSVTLNDGTTPEIKWPSAGQSGIKVLLDQPFAVTDGSTDLLLDFDVGSSFVVRGNSISQNGLLFKPVIRVTSAQAAATLSGSVHADSATGPALAGVTVEVLKAGTALDDTASANVVRTGVTDVSGNFTLAFVPLGTYVVRATPPAESLYQPALLSGGVTISTIGTVANQVIVLTK
jgi:hypothetical protein